MVTYSMDRPMKSNRLASTISEHHPLGYFLSDCIRIFTQKWKQRRIRVQNWNYHEEHHIRNFGKNMKGINLPLWLLAHYMQSTRWYN
jgi:hypothetical protein